MSEILPAMTPEEWAALKKEIPDPIARPGYVEHPKSVRAYYSNVVLVNSGFGGGDIDPPLRHATAALCLHGQPYGFTHEDVAMLRDMPDGTGYASIDNPARFTSLIARIAALLPPETP